MHYIHPKTNCENAGQRISNIVTAVLYPDGQFEKQGEQTPTCPSCLTTYTLFEISGA